MRSPPYLRQPRARRRITPPPSPLTLVPAVAQPYEDAWEETALEAALALESDDEESDEESDADSRRATRTMAADKYSCVADCAGGRFERHQYTRAWFVTDAGRSACGIEPACYLPVSYEAAIAWPLADSRGQVAKRAGATGVARRGDVGGTAPLQQDCC